MASASDIDAIGAFMAGAQGSLPQKRSSGQIDQAQYVKGAGIINDFLGWYRDLGWYAKNVDSDATFAVAKGKRNNYNFAVTPHDAAWVNATSADVPEEEKTFKLDKKGQVVHKKTGAVVSKKARSDPRGGAAEAPTKPAARGGGAKLKPAKEETPAVTAAPIVVAPVEAGMFGSFTGKQVAIGAGITGFFTLVALALSRGGHIAPVIPAHARPHHPHH